MKNNKGFAITATIYGFLILFLIILLSVLSVMRSQNNRSITISEKIENKLFPVNETIITGDDLKENNYNDVVKKRGKYYANVFCGTATLPQNYHFYAGKSSNINNITLYNEKGEKVTDCTISSMVITKYYTSE